jgi:hypothetical protein
MAVRGKPASAARFKGVQEVVKMKVCNTGLSARHSKSVLDVNESTISLVIRKHQLTLSTLRLTEKFVGGARMDAETDDGNSRGSGKEGEVLLAVQRPSEPLFLQAEGG